jgi:hypothetical protein
MTTVLGRVESIVIMRLTMLNGFIPLFFRCLNISSIEECERYILSLETPSGSCFQALVRFFYPYLHIRLEWVQVGVTMKSPGFPPFFIRWLSFRGFLYLCQFSIGFSSSNQRSRGTSKGITHFSGP